MEKLKNNKGITIVVLVIIIALAVSFVFAIYFSFIRKDEQGENTASAQNDLPVNETNSAENTVENTAVNTNAQDIVTEWKIQKALKGNEEVGLQEIYGSSLKYGTGKFTLNEDNTFKDELAPIYDSEDNRKGTYTVDGNKITLTYASGGERELTYNSADKTIEYQAFDGYIIILEKEIEEDTDNTEEVYNIQGSYYPDIEGANDAPHYTFSNGEVTLEGNYVQTGTFEISGKTIKIHFTKIEGPDEENGKYIDEDDELTIIDEDTLEWNGTDGNTVYNSKYVRK